MSTMLTEPTAVAPPPTPEEEFSALQDSVFASVMSTVKTATTVAAEDILFQRSANPEFGTLLDSCNARLLKLANQMLHSVGIGSNVAVPQLKDPDEIDLKWDSIVEAVDDLLEKADTCLDEYTGAVKRRRPEPSSGKAAVSYFLGAIFSGGLANSELKLKAPRQRQLDTNAWKTSAADKPQRSFEEKIDNMDTSPWKPLLTAKPHAIAPLEESLRLVQDEHGREIYAHPYQQEIESMEYPREIYTWSEPVPPEDWDEVPFTWVDTPEALQEMIKDMRRCSEIAVDLEHHDLRSYVGITCLMQISTRDDDYIVDTLKLRGKLQPLNEVFANPKVIKVLHGAFMDVIWLQRDLGLYLVGLFDTFDAAQALGFPAGSLAFVLKKYVNFEADKRYQLADWRIRPLPKEMLDYARSDTHYLLYCFDKLRNELVENSRSTMDTVLQRSKETALKRYVRGVYDITTGSGALGWDKLLSKMSITGVQKVVFKAVHAWRDRVAREMDESPHFVLTRASLVNLATSMPTSVAGVLKCCPAAGHIPRKKASELAQLIKEAQDSANGNKGTTAGPPLAATPGSDTKISVDVFEVDKIPGIRTQASSFWGKVSGSSKWETVGQGHIVNREVRLAVPLPELTAAIFVTGDGLSSPTPRKVVDPGARAEHQYVKDRGNLKTEDEILVIKSLGGGRKRKMGAPAGDTTATGPAGSSPIQSLHGEKGSPLVEADLPERDGEHTSSGRHKKRKKEHQGQESQAEGDALSSIDAGQGAVEAFDYSKAPSILQGKKRGEDTGSQSRRSSGPNKAFDPYSNPEDGPKGMRKGQRERAGKSMTFKS